MKFSAIFVHKKISFIFSAALLLCIVLCITVLYLVYIPKKYGELVSGYAAEYGVEEDLVFAVIRAESNFRADAVSTAGAQGLMQLMPSTARFISECVGEDLDVDVPEDNIRMGIWYIAYLQKKFAGPAEVLAAYNAGEGAVRQWLKDERFSRDGVSLQTIPIAETKKYVSRVKKFYNYYKFFY